MIQPPATTNGNLRRPAVPLSNLLADLKFTRCSAYPAVFCAFPHVRKGIAGNGIQLDRSGM